MTKGNKHQVRKDKWAFFSAVGSAASLAALVIVLIDKVEKDKPQMVVWQMTFAFICLLVSGVVCVLTYDYIKNVVSEKSCTLRIKTLKILIVLLFALFLFAIFLDGIFAAIYNYWWLESLKGLFPFLRP